MIVHIVLFRPRPDMPEPERAALIEALQSAAQGIPSVRRFSVGRRVRHGRSYEEAMPRDFEYAAVVEFDNLEGLKAYLDDPLHHELGRRFWKAIAAGLIYDYEMLDVQSLKSED